MSARGNGKKVVDMADENGDIDVVWTDGGCLVSYKAYKTDVAFFTVSVYNIPSIVIPTRQSIMQIIIESTLKKIRVPLLLKRPR